MECHAAIGKKVTAAKVPHKPILQEGGCTNCHAAHFSKGKGLLPADEKTVCLSCHGNDKLGVPPLKNIKKELEGKKYLHGPIQQGKCTACSRPSRIRFFPHAPGQLPLRAIHALQGRVIRCLSQMP